MRYISTPSPIVLENPITGEALNAPPKTFRDFVVEALLADRKFESDLKALLSSEKIRQAVTTTDNSVALEDADYERLREVVETPTLPAYGYQAGGGIARQLLPFCKAILNASENPP